MKPLFSKVLPFLILTAALLCQFYPTLESKFEMIDDHDIVNHFKLASDNFSWKQFAKSLRTVSYLEADGRFRPGLHLMRTGQVALFGKNPLAWHFAELTIALITAYFLYGILLQLLHPPLAVLATLLCFAGVHSESWIRLLTTEAWALCFFAIGLYFMVPKKINTPFPSLRFTLGLIFCWFAALTKESFIPLLPVAVIFCAVLCPVLGLGNYDLKGSLRKRSTLWLAFLTISALILHAYAILMGLQHLSVRYVFLPFKERWLEMDFRTQRLIWKNAWIVPLLVMLHEAILLVEFQFKPRLEFWKAQRSIVLTLVLGILFCFIPQWIVYGNALHYLRHYFIPVNLFVVFTAAILLRLMIQSMQKPLSAFFFLFGVTSTVCFELGWAIETHRYAALRAKTSNEFQLWLERLVWEKKQDPNSIYVFCSSIGHYEHMESVARYLRHYLKEPIKPTLALEWKEMTSQANDPQVSWLRNAEKYGSVNFSPSTELGKHNRRKIGVYFAGSTRHCEYDRLYRADSFDK